MTAAGLLPHIRCGKTGLKPEQLQGRRPNIILVMPDDQGYGDLACHGNPVLKTPQLDALYAHSLRFTKFQVSPTCSPTRSCLMTGRHEFKNGVTHTLGERERLAQSSVTIAEVLKQAGYATGIFGKWHLGDEDDYQPERRGFDETFIHGAGGIGQNYPPTSCADVPPNQENRYFDPVIKHNGTFVKTKGFCSDVFFRQALGWINQQRQGEKPFFAYIVTNAPHAPFIAPDKYKQRFLDLDLPKGLPGFYGMIENIDDNMSLLINKLAEWGLEEDTLLIFMTDNGTSAGHAIYNAGMKGNKGTPEEGGTRVPAFFSWKGVLPEGTDVDRLTAHIDLFPTLAALAGVDLPSNGQVEGRSLLPLLQNQGTEWTDRFLFTHLGRWKKGTDPDLAKFKQCAVRSDRFRFVNNSELYDMSADPGQTTDVIEKYPEIVQKMRSAYDVWWREARALMVNEEVVYEGVAPFIKNYQKQLQTQGIPDWKPPLF
ncbi:MAG: sulfatase-like hydrolase/transferase [Candidatus Aminicenantes bacterium]|nr:sulfatase-like hydrolase/transferase [Candidatus Aminicenantes bacterium]